MHILLSEVIDLPLRMVECRQRLDWPLNVPAVYDLLNNVVGQSIFIDHSNSAFWYSLDRSDELALKQKFLVLNRFAYSQDKTRYTCSVSLNLGKNYESIPSFVSQQLVVAQHESL